MGVVDYLADAANDFFNDEGMQRELYPTRAGPGGSYVTETPIDAFRHVAAHAMLTELGGRLVVGPVVSRVLGDALEEARGDGRTGSNTIMDLFKNCIGRNRRADGIVDLPKEIFDKVEELVRNGISINSPRDPRVSLVLENLLPGESATKMLERTGGRIAGPSGMGYDLLDPRGPWQDPRLFDNNISGPAAPESSIRPRPRSDPTGSPLPLGPAVNEPRPGFSEPSQTGYAGRGPYDLEGPGAGGRQGVGDSDGPGARGESNSGPSREGAGLGGSPGSGDRGAGDLRPGQTRTTTTTRTVDTPAGPREVTVTERTDVAGRTPDDPGFVGPRPILLDLDGTGIEITELPRSTIFMDAGGDGLLHRTAWAGAGDGVLFFDPDGRDDITEKRQYVFTEWDPTAKDDLDALRSVFDSDGDGQLTAADADFAKFKVMVTKADGSTSVMTLAALGITEIDLAADTTRIVLPDGSTITGQATSTRWNGTTGPSDGRAPTRSGHNISPENSRVRAERAALREATSFDRLGAKMAAHSGAAAGEVCRRIRFPWPARGHHDSGDAPPIWTHSSIRVRSSTKIHWVRTGMDSQYE